MEAAVDWLFSTLSARTPEALRSIVARHRLRDDAFDLAEALTFLPARRHSNLGKLLWASLEPALATFSCATKAEDSDEDATDDTDTVRAAAEMLWMLVQNRREPLVAELRDVICELHDVLLDLPKGPMQNMVSRLCEWVWLNHANDPVHDRVIPQTMLFLLVRTFGGEVQDALAEGNKPTRRSGSSRDVTRVYNMREALESLHLAQDASDAETIRNLLLRCSTAAVYLRLEQGRKFIAFLLGLKDIRDAVMASLRNQLATARKTRAAYYGGVFLLAWKKDKGQWMFDAMKDVIEKAIFAGIEPLATNLRTILSSFHSNKRLPGVDSFLNRLYEPVLYDNLKVANPFVRKNAVMIMADAFPIHEPTASMEEIEEAVGKQCKLLIELFDDPAPVVRQATVEGSSRILGLLWEIIPLQYAKKMVHILTTKLAFDSTSIQVRCAVFYGLKFLAQNHLAHHDLSVALPRLRCLIHDNAERVRLSFLDLLVRVKSKRLQHLRYFQIVPVEDLLIRLPLESAPGSMKIMSLLTSAYFPLEKKGKTADEIASSQVRACLAMLHTSKEACEHFYRHLYLHAPPGPLCEFAMRLSALALDSPEDANTPITKPRRKAPTGTGTRRSKRRSRTKVNDENEPPTHNNIMGGSDEMEKSRPAEPDRATLLNLVADVLSSILTSLGKPANAVLRKYIDDIFGGDALKTLLIERGNTSHSRAICWRIASCMSYAKVAALGGLWREQLETVLQWPRGTARERECFQELLSALMLCAVRWDRLTTLSTVVSGWADAAAYGHRTKRVPTKSMKRSNSARSQSGRQNRSQKKESEGQLYMTRCNAIFALRSCAAVLLEEVEVREELDFLLSLHPHSSNGGDDFRSTAADLIQSVRKGCTGAIDHTLEAHSDETSTEEERPEPHHLLDCLSLAWKLCVTRLSRKVDLSSVLEELRALLEWSSMKDLWKQASKMDQSFARGLVSITCAYCADAIAIGVLEESDTSFLVSLCQNMQTQTWITDSGMATRPIIEMLRVSYQLGAVHLLERRSDKEGKASSSFLKTSESYLSIAGSILGDCKVAEAHATGSPRAPTVLDAFLSELLLFKCRFEEKAALESLLGELLCSCFKDADKSKGSLLASSLCNTVSSLATSGTNKAGEAGVLHDLIMNSLQPETADVTTKKALVNYTGSIVDSIYTIYSESDTSPSNKTRRFLAFAEVSFHKQFRKDDVTATGDEDLQSAVAEARGSLVKLRKLCNPEKSSSALEFNEQVNEIEGKAVDVDKDLSEAFDKAVSSVCDEDKVKLGNV